MKYQNEVCSSVTAYWPCSSVDVTVKHTRTRTHKQTHRHTHTTHTNTIYFKSTLSVLFPQQLLFMNEQHVNNDLYNR